MERTNFRGLSLSRLMLGTVQFGLDYGIANKAGKPRYEKSREILAFAFENGVNCFDTAAAYGNSEAVLGRAFEELKIKDQVNIVSKVLHITDESLADCSVNQFVERSVVNSLKNLKLDALPICLFHMEDNLDYMESLVKMKDKGLVRYVGVSADTGEGAARIVACPDVEAIQLPYNVFDKRYDKNNVFKRASERNIAVFSRSTYLQGLFFIQEGDLRETLRPIIPVRERIQELASESGMVLAELCMRYVIAKKEISCVLTGVDSLEQMRENLGLFGKGALTPALVDRIEQIVPDFPETIVRPCLWQQGGMPKDRK